MSEFNKNSFFFLLLMSQEFQASFSHNNKVFTEFVLGTTYRFNYHLLSISITQKPPIKCISYYSSKQNIVPN